jgi:cytochrome c-type biogenesis protein CcmH
MRVGPFSRAVWGVCLVVAAALAVATVLRPLVAPPTLQQRVLAIAADVRCPECQGESAAESNAAASLAIRAEIAADLQAGQGQAQILREIAAQYGEWILYRPPAQGAFLLLWGTPLLALAAVAGVVSRLVRQRRAQGNGGDSRAAAGEGPAADAPAVSAEARRQLARFI